jgi:hypothetical protein
MRPVQCRDVNPARNANVDAAADAEANANAAYVEAYDDYLSQFDDHLSNADIDEIVDNMRRRQAEQLHFSESQPVVIEGAANANDALGLGELPIHDDARAGADMHDSGVDFAPMVVDPVLTQSRPVLPHQSVRARSSLRWDDSPT